MNQIWIKKIQKCCMILFAFVLFIGNTPASVYAEDGSGTPQLFIAGDTVFDVNAGTENVLKVTIKNKGDGVAENVVVRAKAEEAMSPFKINFSDGENVGHLGTNGFKTLNMYVTMEELPDKASYPIVLSYSCKNGSSGSETIYIRVNGYERDPSYTFGQMSMTPEPIAPGESGTLSGTLSNTGGQVMYQTEVILDQLKTEGISVDGGFSSIQFGKMEIGQSETFSFPISTSSEMATGNYPVTVKLKYQDATGKEFEKTQDYYIKVEGEKKEEKNYQIVVQNMVEPSGVYDVNQNFPIKFELKNTGNTTIKNIVVTAEGQEASAVVPKSTSMKNIPQLEAGQTVALDFTFAATSQSSTQNYAIQFTIEYVSDNDKTVTFKQFAGVNIVNSAKDKKEAEKEEEENKKENTSKPKIIVSNYVCNPTTVMAGQEFDLDLTLLNTHQQKAVKNIKMFLTLAEETSSDSQKSGNIFTPVNSSNTFYFDAISPKNTVGKKLRLYVVPEAQPKTYTLTVNFEYEDAEGKEYTATELLGINVKQTSELSLDEIAVPEMVEQFMPVTISMNYYNTGKVALSNVMFRVEGDVDTSQKNTYIGNMEPGASDYLEISFTPSTIGEVPVSIVASYEDASGETIEQKREFTLHVTEPMMMEDEFIMEEPESTIDAKKIALIVGGVIVVVGGIVIFVKKHNQKKSDALIEAIDEDDDEDDK